jgi:flavin-dependent dehydrogenase
MSGHVRCTARFPTPTTAGAVCPRRTVLDHLLLSAAAESGVEVREGFSVDELLMTDGVVVGVRGHGRGTRPFEERARVVIGADGAHSFVARTVRAPEYRRAAGRRVCLLLVLQQRHPG